MTTTVETKKLTKDLDGPFTLTAEQIAFYNENGYIKLKHVLSPELLQHYRDIIAGRVAELSAGAIPLEQRTTYGKAFFADYESVDRVRRG